MMCGILKDRYHNPSFKIKQKINMLYIISYTQRFNMHQPLQHHSQSQSQSAATQVFFIRPVIPL